MQEGGDSNLGSEYWQVPQNDEFSVQVLHYGSHSILIFKIINLKNLS